MIISHEDFVNCFNSKIFEDSKKELLEKIAKTPDRYVGIFRPTKAKIKILQNITQSHEVRFGDAMELIIQNYFENFGYESLNKRLVCENCEYSLDQFLKKDDHIYFIEQKVRDDHDSTKKRGQIENFEKKLYELIKIYGENNIDAYFYFIDPSLSKNKNYYAAEISKITNDYGVRCHLFYGKELFDHFNLPQIWDDIIVNLTYWRANLPDFPEFNFDKDFRSSFDEIKELPPSYWNKIFDNKKVVNEVLPVLFPEKKTLLLLDEYFISNSNKKIYKTLHEKLSDVINNRILV